MRIVLSLWQSVPRGWRDGLWTFVRAPLNLFAHSLRDAARFLRHNTFEALSGEKNTEYNILMLSHMIEKGLALRNTRPFFGADVVDLLIDKTMRLKKAKASNSHSFGTALNALASYIAFNQQFPDRPRRFEIQSSAVADLLEASSAEKSGVQSGATVAAPSPGFNVEQQALVQSLITTRHSIRHFSNVPVPTDTVLRAVEMAQRSPSSCNLQPTRVLVVADKPTIVSALEIQQGARGFKNEVCLLLVVTYEVGLQIGPRSRHQGYTDSGIFAGTLMLALHSLNIASCPLNWAAERRNDRQLRALLRLPESQNVVMLIACGYAETDTKAALSARRPLTEVCRIWHRS